MPIRITGMNSGLDTESIITELVKAQKTKSENVKKAQTKLEWKQDAWKELNSKIYKLFNGTLSNMRMEADYSKKTTDVSDSSVASVVTSGTAMNVSQKLIVKSLASNAYITSGAVAATDGSSKLADLGVTENIKVKVGSETKEIAVTEDMTVDNFVSKLKEFGMEASFDAKNQRFHIASKESGSANNIVFEDNSATAALKLTSTSGAAVNAATAAVISLNGAEYTSNSNTFEVNGLTITALQVSEQDATTGEYKATTLTTRQDTDGIYDMIKNFLKEYNALINEMDKLYNAESSKGYEPLTDDEKSELSDSEVDKWEKKIKDSILRRDSNLSTVSSAMKNIMLQGISVNGEQMYLSDFGVETLGYFSAEENERNAYHISGDADDSAVSSGENKLKAAIAADPDSVISFFSQLSNNLYKELNEQSRSVEGIRTFGKFYDDKKMQEEYNDYTTKIKEQEAKLTAMEDRWYSKFSAMETALAKLQSNQNAVSSLLGGL